MEAYGIATVIDLRSPAEIAQSPNPFADGAGPAYLNIGVVDDASMRKLGEASEMLERYMIMINQRQEAFRDVFTAMADAEGGVLFHCFAGKDRTGLVAAMLLSVTGVDAEHITADFGETDVQLAGRYARWIAEAEPERRAEMREELRCPPERILGVLEYVQGRWGGVDGYLEAAGVSPERIDRLSSKLA